eukprot:Gregarina_sp_Pseudo_9__1407@NODE_1940_length_1240_cov_664_405495_g1798_i0_p1_GENE_NODE_1940_length_1240_cov_664_405495_g1798_i0NODE_1940_length_1240_cov_664_405495_g1798_i0_p1_ORF_typecomplete_len248_score37_48_NODE_1940_length_1240_cov_664_405495_g1798_i03991142
MIFRLVLLSAIAITLANAMIWEYELWTKLIITNNDEKCQVSVCEKTPEAMLTTDQIEACLDATPTACTFEALYTKSVQSFRVCDTSLGFSLEEILPPFGTPIGWGDTEKYPSQILPAMQDFAGNFTCDYEFFQAHSCDDLGPSAGTVTTDIVPIYLMISKSLPIEVVQSTHIVFQNTGTHVDPKCQSLVTQVEASDLAVNMGLTGRIAARAGEGDTTTSSPTRDSGAAASRALATLALATAVATLFN